MGIPEDYAEVSHPFPDPGGIDSRMKYTFLDTANVDICLALLGLLFQMFCFSLFQGRDWGGKENRFF